MELRHHLFFLPAYLHILSQLKRYIGYFCKWGFILQCSKINSIHTSRVLRPDENEETCNWITVKTISKVRQHIIYTRTITQTHTPFLSCGCKIQLYPLTKYLPFLHGNTKNWVFKISSHWLAFYKSLFEWPQTPANSINVMSFKSSFWIWKGRGLETESKSWNWRCCSRYVGGSGGWSIAAPPLPILK